MLNDNKKKGVEGGKRDSNEAAAKGRTLWQPAKSMLTGKDGTQNGKKSSPDTGDNCVDDGHTYCPPPVAPSSSS